MVRRALSGVAAAQAAAVAIVPVLARRMTIFVMLVISSDTMTVTGRTE